MLLTTQCVFFLGCVRVGVSIAQTLCKTWVNVKLSNEIFVA